ncbi:hypothetical protein EG327_011561 [Venturia inaequalis]|uniref:Uncharacterized protein n=1 Tax=Venturia inaequalis TaxID=5025 RepID=A0A8H3YNC4_VENIN|nr:hypothetical protein EG327_011561 [Venturia inaequalis]
MTRLAVPVFLAFSALTSAAPPQAGSAAVNAVATPTNACSAPTPADNNSPSNDNQTPSSPCTQQLLRSDDPPWGNGVPPMVTILPGLPVFSDKETCKKNHKLLTQMEDKFMKNVAQVRKDKPFDYYQPTFAVRGGACVTSDYQGPADQQDRYRTYNNNFPQGPAPTGGYGGWSGGQQQGGQDGSWNGNRPQGGPDGTWNSNRPQGGQDGTWNSNRPQGGSRGSPPPQPNNAQPWQPRPWEQQSNPQPNNAQPWAGPPGQPPAETAAERKSIAAERKPIAAERKSIAAERKSIAAERKSIAAERKPTAAERKPIAAECKPTA